MERRSGGGGGKRRDGVEGDKGRGEMKTEGRREDRMRDEG